MQIGNDIIHCTLRKRIEKHLKISGVKYLERNKSGRNKIMGMSKRPNYYRCTVLINIPGGRSLIDCGIAPKKVPITRARKYNVQCSL